MKSKQLSVFIENRTGRLGEVLSVLKDNGINILSLSLADTTEFGLLRLIVSDAELGKKKLAESGFSTMTTDVLVVKIDNKAGSLEKLVKVLCENSINVEYMYGLTEKAESASIVLKASDSEKAEKVLSGCGVTLLSTEEILKL